MLNPISYPFKVTVNPCLLLDVFLTPLLENVSYQLKEPDQTFGGFTFEQSPACNLIPVTTVSKPAFVNYDDTTKTFTVLQTSDESLINTYQITIESVYTWRTSLTDPLATDSRTETITYELDVHPCEIDPASVVTGSAQKASYKAQWGYFFSVVTTPFTSTDATSCPAEPLVFEYTITDDSAGLLTYSTRTDAVTGDLIIDITTSAAGTGSDTIEVSVTGSRRLQPLAT